MEMMMMMMMMTVKVKDKQIYRFHRGNRPGNSSAPISDDVCQNLPLRGVSECVADTGIRRQSWIPVSDVVQGYT
jgi:hypothetical protein